MLSGAPSLQANQPNTEVFLNALGIAALSILLRGFKNSHSVLPAIGVGVCWALGSTIKQLVVVDAFLLSCAHMLYRAELPGGFRRAARDVLICALVGALVWAAVFAWFAATGRLEIFWTVLVKIPRGYSSQPLFTLYRYFREGRFLPSFLWFAIPVALLVLLGAFGDRHENRSEYPDPNGKLSRWRRLVPGREWALYLVAVLSLQLKIVVNGAGFLPHYYQYWLPILAIGSGWAIAADRPGLSVRSRRFLAAAGAAVALYLVVQQGRFYALTADDWSRLKYGDAVIHARTLGRKLQKVLRPDEPLYMCGEQVEIYYFAGQKPRTYSFWRSHLSDTWPGNELLLKRQLASLDRTPPELLLVEATPTEPTSASDNPAHRPGLVARLLGGGASTIDHGRNARKVLDRLLPHYRKITLEALNLGPNYDVYIRRGGTLERRLQASHPELEDRARAASSGDRNTGPSQPLAWTAKAPD